MCAINALKVITVLGMDAVLVYKGVQCVHLHQELGIIAVNALKNTF